MKGYLNPNQYAVDRVNKIKKNSSKDIESKDKKEKDNLRSKKSNKEIFKTKSEEQAWKDVLKKDRSQ